MGNAKTRLPSRLIVRVFDTCLGLVSTESFGSVDSSILTVTVVPRLSMELPGSGMMKVPSLPDVASPSTFPLSSTTVILTPETRVHGSVRVSLSCPTIWMTPSCFSNVAGGHELLGAASAGAPTASITNSAPRTAANKLNGRNRTGLLLSGLASCAEVRPGRDEIRREPFALWPDYSEEPITKTDTSESARNRRIACL